MLRTLGFVLVAVSRIAGQDRVPFVLVPDGVRQTPSKLEFREPMAGFEARDVTGRLWRSADLTGKLTVVSGWATWCIPCRAEHPALQDFYRQMDSLPNVQVLTFSADRDVPPVTHYLQEKNYTFPVIADPKLESRVPPPEGGLPATIVVGPNGRHSGVLQGWSIGRILLEVERMAKARR